MSWRLRKTDKTTYGPVELPELCRWAAEGRILPDDEISEDKGAWKPAPDLADLELNWLAPDEKGTLRGPFHILVFADLLNRKLLQGDTVITHRVSKEQATVGQAVTAELTRRIEALSAATPDKTASAGKRAEKAEATGLEKTIQDMTRRYESMVARTRTQEDELSDLRQKLATLQQAANERLAEAFEARQQAEEKVEEQRKEIESLKSTQNDLAKNFRDLNERYIQLRDKGGTTSQPASKPKPRLV